MNTPNGQGGAICAIKRIFIAVDSSPESARAAAYVRHMTLPGARIRIASVAESPRTMLPLTSMTAAELQLARTELARDADEAVARERALFTDAGIDVESGVIDISRHGGYPGNALIDAAAEWKADLVVVGARQHHGMLRWIEGTVSEFVTTEAPCSILIVPGSYEAGIQPSARRILFALDGSAASLDALHFGLGVAAPESRLCAIYVIDRAAHITDLAPMRVLERAFVEEGQAILAAAERVFADLSNASEIAFVKTAPTRDDVPHAIVRHADQWGADLIVLGTHGRRGISRWFLGSVAARTARLTHTPLLLARPAPRP